MITKFHLTVNSGGTVRVSKGKPQLGQDEVTIEMAMELPNSLFKKPQLQAKIVVTDADVPPHIITPEMKNNIQDALQTAAGVVVRLELIEPEKIDSNGK